jgi:hypothetical protein
VLLSRPMRPRWSPTRLESAESRPRRGLQLASRPSEGVDNSGDRYDGSETNDHKPGVAFVGARCTDAIDRVVDDQKSQSDQGDSGREES